MTPLEASCAAMTCQAVVGCYTLRGVPELLDLDLLDDHEPFEIDAQATHLFKHAHLGVDDVLDVWASDPLFYPAKPQPTG